MISLFGGVFIKAGFLIGFGCSAAMCFATAFNIKDLEWSMGIAKPILLTSLVLLVMGVILVLIGK